MAIIHTDTKPDKRGYVGGTQRQRLTIPAHRLPKLLCKACGESPRKLRYTPTLGFICTDCR